MDFTAKYTTDIKEDKKILVSNEAYLFAEMISDLRRAVEMMGRRLKNG
jgi:hypothetical protein